MATVPPVVSWSPSLTTEMTHTNLNIRIRNPIDFLKARPLCVLRKNVVQSIPNNVWTDVTWQLEDIDSDFGHSTSSNTHLYTSQTAGWYLCTTTVEFQGNGNGFRAARFRHSNGGTNGDHYIMMNGSTHGADVNTAWYFYLAVGETICVQAWHDAGPSLNAQIDGLDSRFEIQWVSV